MIKSNVLIHHNVPFPNRTWLNEMRVHAAARMNGAVAVGSRTEEIAHMGIRVIVHRDAYELGICRPAVCLIRNVQVQPTEHTLDNEITELMHTVANAPETILDRPEVRGFRDLFATMGYPKQVPAGERLIESFRRRGFKKYNNIIDAYNIASVRFGSGLGMHEGAGLDSDIHVHRATGHEHIIPLFKTKAAAVKTGDLVYSHRMRLCAWLGERDVDSDEFKVADATNTLLLVALGNAATSAEYNRDACEHVMALITRTCPHAVAEFLDVHCLAE